MPQTAHGVAAVLLAAGGGTRLGGGKLLLPWRGRPLIAHLLGSLTRSTGLGSLTVVLGHDADSLRHVVARAVAGATPPPPFACECMLNQNWREGLSTSLQCGLANLLAAPGSEKIRAVMFLLADQPLVTTRTLNTLVQAHAAAQEENPEHPATAPAYQGRRGNPVIVSRNLFPAIMALRGDTGARHILADLGGGLLLVPVDDPGILHDVDTPEAYAALLARGGNTA